MRNFSLFITLFLVICLSENIDAQISGPETINFSTTDNNAIGVDAIDTNGATVIDGDGGSTDITGVQINIAALNTDGVTLSGEKIYFNITEVGFGAAIEEGLSLGTDPSTKPWPSGGGISIKTDDRSEFDFNGFETWEFSAVSGVTLRVEGYKDGVSTGSTTVNTASGDRESHPSADPSKNEQFTDAIFGNVDEVRIIATTDFYGTFDVFAFDAVAVSNVAPTLTSFAGPVETTNEDTGVEITFAELTAQGNQMDSDGTVDVFVVQAVSTGTLTINGAPYLAGVNEEITAVASASWTPDANENGTLNAFTLKAKDDDGALSSNAIQATVSVTAVNDEPSFTKGVNETVLEDAGAQTVSNWATSLNKGASNESGQTLSFAVTNNNNNLFSTQPAVDASGNLTYTPAANANGAANVDVILSDDGGTANSGDDTFTTQQFTITVMAVNDEPSFTKGANQEVDKNSGAQTVNGWATSLNKGATDESGQTLSFAVTNNNNGLFSAQPAIDASGNLTFTPATDATGVATVTVVLSDDGGTSNGGDDEFAAQQFNITVVDPATVPSITTIAASSILASGATLNGDVTSDGGAAITERGFVYSKTADPGTPTLAEVNGSTVVKVAVSGTTGTFNETLTSLTPNTGYSFIAYAINSEGTSEGSVQTFTTLSPTIAFNSTSSNGAESVSSANLSVDLSVASAATVTVDYKVTGTATGNGTDYALANGTLTFNPGENIKNLTIASIVDDAILEADETVIVTLSNPTNASLGTNLEHVYTITNNDVAAVTINNVSGGEDQSSGITVTATLDNMVDGGFSVNVNSRDITAKLADGDYAPVNSETLTFDGLVGESKTFTLIPIVDAKLELDEKVGIFMDELSTSIVSASDINITDEATVTITNDDLTVVTIADISGNEDDGSITVTATLEGSVDGGFTIDVSTKDGTASTSDSDYTAPIQQTLTFAGSAGETQTFTITPIADSKLEANETLTVSMSNLSASVVNPSLIEIIDEAIVTINNDDIAPSISFASASSEGPESTKSTLLEIRLSAVSGLNVTADLILTGTATDSDFNKPDPANLTIEAGSTSIQFGLVDIVDDAIYEGDETVIVTLTNPTNATLGPNPVHTYTILDNDNAPPTDISLGVSDIDENNAVDDLVGDLSTTDADAQDSHTYSLVPGTGDTDNTKFYIDGASLLASEPSFNHETNESFSIRIQTDDGKGGTFEKVFTIDVNDVNEAPIGIMLSKDKIDETDDAGVEVGIMSSLDPDAQETFTYSLVTGEGDANNLLFTFAGNQLRTAAAINFEETTLLSIRVRVTDSGGLTFDQVFSITVNDVVIEPLRDFDKDETDSRVKNFFTPNGDGQNDTWVVEDILDNPINEVKVYSQAGKLIFSQRNYENDWDGTFDGEPIPPGTYYYEINIYNGESIIRGFITIIRNQ